MRWLPALCLASGILYAAEDKLRLVRESDALTPEQEQAALHVPPGFTVQLFASEPMINKPINMAFDARGRLWVSSTVEYPYAAVKERWADAQGSSVEGSRDAIKILEDTDGDGKADKVTDFAGGLNIPTGVLPWHKPGHKDGCIAWSIPNIWYFADTNGDGKCDKREVLFGPLGYEKDTHGMCSSFRLGLDGWVYATHGFNNTSHFKAKDGSTLDLHSGNVFRFRPDGSRVELWSAGQVNPFGLCWDRYGNLYSADCHSNPITQLIRGACYPSFGKPHDGLGFGPVMCEHSHGSTGLCGIIYIDGGIWGPEWDDHMFLGNCVTSKVNHDKITFTGSTPKANEQPDFITSDDLWFRPVDLQLGPDNALYIADFYNKIVGHYEVPLDHPGRDRERGRIWRVVRQGEESSLKTWADGVQTKRDGMKWAMSSDNAVSRRLAFQAFDLSPPNLDLSTKSWCGTGDPFFSENATEPFGRLALRHGGKEWHDRVVSFCASILKGEYRSLGGTAARIIGEIPQWDDTIGAAMQDALENWVEDEPLGNRAIIEAVSAHAHPRYIGGLLQIQRGASARDLSLLHALRIAIREHLRLPGVFASLGNDDKALVADIAKAVPTDEAAAFLFDEWKAERLKDPLNSLLGIIARNGSPSVLDSALAEAHKLKLTEAVEAASAMYNALLERGTPPPAALLTWATDLAESLLAAQQSHTSEWTTVPHSSHPSDDSPWCLQDRKCADGSMAKVISSLNQDKKSPEKLTGILHSKPFAAPATLSFWICGHQGLPKTEANHKNLVRLMLADKSVREAFPPRNDVCQRIEWDLSDVKGREVRLEVVDGDDGPSYAWLGITRIDPAVVGIETFSSDNEKQKQLRTLAAILRTTAPVGLRDKLAPYMPKPAVAPEPPKPRLELDALIASRRASFAKAKPDVAKGEAIFKTNCAVCHTIKGQGGVIGPQLDGVGNRGADRLMEDILDPNRNVDAHFHLHQLKLRDGSTATGFIRGEAGQVTILVDAANNEQRISKGDIVEDRELPQSLMPPVFAQTITEKDFTDLIGWLLVR